MRATSRQLAIYAVLGIAGLLTLIFVVPLVVDSVRRFMDAVIPGAGSRGYTTSMTPVTLRLTDQSKRFLVLRVPKAYLTDVKTWRGGAAEILWLETAIPDLLPAPAFGVNLSDEQKKNGVMIRLYSERAGASFGKNVYASIAAENALIAPDVHGLQHFRGRKPHSCDNREYVLQSPTTIPEFREMALQSNERVVCWPYGREYFVTPPQSTARFVRIDCPPRTGVFPNERCGVTTDFDGWRLHYSFRTEELHRWRDFDTGVQKLLRHLVASAGNE